MRQKPLVLLVDDEEIFLEIASTQLQSRGLDTEIAHDVAEAMQKAVVLLPDFVLSDIYMPPGPNGWELAIELHRNPKTKDIRMAFFTSLRDPWLELKKSREQVQNELGRVTFFSKIDDVEVLAESVEKLIKE